jgi:hypothetical protein
MKQVTLRADFSDDPDNISPSRSVIISASSEEEVVERAAAQMNDAARVEFGRPPSRNQAMAAPRDRYKS